MSDTGSYAGEMPDDDVQVRPNRDESRYEILVDDELAGFTQYVLDGGRADFVHTQIDDEFEGHGLASQLIGSALDDARSHGWEVVPYCRFVAHFISTHPGYQDLVPADQRDRFGLTG
jgi:predicted GNAT family acetyltransferase